MYKKYMNRIHSANLGKILIANGLLIMPLYFILAKMSDISVYFTAVAGKFFFSNDSLQSEILHWGVILTPILIILFLSCHSLMKRSFRSLSEKSFQDRAVTYIIKTNRKLWSMIVIYSALYTSLIIFFVTYDLDAGILEAISETTISANSGIHDIKATLNIPISPFKINIGSGGALANM